MAATSYHSGHLPYRHHLTLISVLSLIIGLLMAVVYSAAIFNQTSFYPTEETRNTFATNDLVNLLIGLPILIGSSLIARRGNLAGLLCWPGALFFVLYNEIAYVFGSPFHWGYMIHLILAMLCIYTLVILVAGIDGKALKSLIIGKVPEKLAGGLLAGFGSLFTLRVIAVILGALNQGTQLTGTELAVNISDFLTSPALILGGILLWRQNPMGYVAGLGLLFQSSMLFVALILFMIVQPILINVPISIGDVIFVAAMGLVCFIPFVLFLRGVLSSPIKVEDK